MVGLSRYFCGSKALACRIEGLHFSQLLELLGRRLDTYARHISQFRANEKPRTMPGLLYYRNLDVRSVLRDERTTPVEAVDQRSADGLHDGLEVDIVENRQAFFLVLLAHRNPTILRYALLCPLEASMKEKLETI